MGGASSSDPEVKKHQDSLEQARKEVASLHDDVKKLKENAPKGPSAEDVSALQVKVAKLKDTRHHLRSELSNLEKEQEMDASSKIHHLEGRNRHLVEELRDSSEKVSEHHNENNELEEKYKLLKEHYEKNTEKNGHLAQEIAKNEAIIHGKAGVVEDLRKVRVEIEEFEEKIKNVKSETNSIKDDFVEIHGLETLHQDITNLKSSITELEHKISEYNSKISGFQDLDSLEAELSSTTEKISVVTENLSEAKSAKAHITNEISNFSSENQDLESQISAFTTTPEEVATLHAEKESVKAAVDILEDELKAEKHKWHEIKHDQHDYKTKAEKLVDRRSKNQKRLEEIETIKAFLLEKKDESKNVKATLADRREKIKAHKESLKSEEPSE